MSREDYETVQRLVQRYFFQITMGCGRDDCSNAECFSSQSPPLPLPPPRRSEGPRLAPDDAAVLAVRLARGQTHFLCPGLSNTPPPPNTL
jgi:hypothetical protein